MSGPVVLPVKIGDHTYTLTFKFGTMRLVEAELDGRSLFELMGSGEIGTNALSAIFWAALQPKHRMTRDAADDLIDGSGVERVGAWIAEGLGRYFGKAPPADEGSGGNGAEAVPPKPRSRKPKATS